MHITVIFVHKNFAYDFDDYSQGASSSKLQINVGVLVRETKNYNAGIPDKNIV